LPKRCRNTNVNSVMNGSKRPLSVTMVLFAKGFIMGASDVVPGVSGGTMALILGIYEKLILSIKIFDIRLVRLVLQGQFKLAMRTIPFGFLLPLGFGILTAIFTMARGLSWLLENHPSAIWSFFFGLVLASAMVVARRIGRWGWVTAASFLMATAGAYMLVGMVPMNTPETIPYIFLCGAIAICAMILPGISGSFILVLLGKYKYILDAVATFDLRVLLVFTIGTLSGILLFVRLLSWLLRHHYRITMAALTGLMIGSLRKIWPWKSFAMPNTDGSIGGIALVNTIPQEVDGDLFLAIALAIIGGVMVIFLQRLAEK